MTAVDAVDATKTRFLIFLLFCYISKHLISLGLLLVLAVPLIYTYD